MKITETLEEAIEFELSFIHNSCRNFDFDLGFKIGMLLGTRWQQEQNQNLYSEKEVLDILEKSQYEVTKRTSLKEWFEQFKNK